MNAPAWFLTCWLIYGEGPPPQQWEFPTQEACLGAQSRWDRAAVVWMQEHSALQGRVVVSRCDPAGQQPKVPR